MSGGIFFQRIRHFVISFNIIFTSPYFSCSFLCNSSDLITGNREIKKGQRSSGGEGEAD
jgi:hypothetical protein